MKQERHLARDEDGWYGIYDDEPKKTHGDWDGSLVYDLLSEREFHKIFGCHPVRKGRKRKIKRILIELED